jgi:hypothetical protein
MSRRDMGSPWIEVDMRCTTPFIMPVIGPHVQFAHAAKNAEIENSAFTMD